MALTDSNMGPADIAAVMGGNGFGGLGGWGNGDFWLILILLFAFGGFGGWGGMGGYGGYGEAALGGAIYPWMNQLEYTQAGFSQQATNTALGNISDAVNAGFAGVNTSLCSGFAGVNQNLSNGFAGVNQAVANGFAQAEIADNARQIANMQQAFNSQTATTGAINGVQSQLAQCCCDNRLGTESLRATVLQENCQDRYEAANNARDIIANATSNTQALLDSNQKLMDKLCALELDGVRNQLAQAERENVGLQNQLNMAALRESQTAQNAFISQGFANEVDQLYNRLSNCPVPSVPVFGRTPIFNCGGSYGCGCGQ